MAAQTQKSSQEKEEARKKYITALLYFQLPEGSMMTQMSENLIKNVCYSKQMIIFANKITSVLCWCRNMRQKALRSFPNRYLFSLYHKVSSSLSIRYILRIILWSKNYRADYQRVTKPSLNAHFCCFLPLFFTLPFQLTRDATYHNFASNFSRFPVEGWVNSMLSACK